MNFAIVSAKAAGFKVIDFNDFDCDNEVVVALYEEKADAEAGLARAKALEETIRPLWLAALAHANKLESLMLDAVWATAKPLAKADTAG